jgi:protein-disulfide isomerase
MSLIASITRRLAPLAIATLALTAACSDNSSSPKDLVPVNPVLTDVVMGDAAAPVTMTEFASLTCPHCRDFWKQVFPRIKETYIDTGKVKYILKDYPTPPAEIALAGTAIARCAGADGYYAVVDDIFTNWHEMMQAAQQGGAGPFLVEVGGRHGVDPEEVRSCLNNKPIQDFVNATITEARTLQVTGTPTIFLNGEKIEDGHTFEGLSAAIEAKLNPGAAPAAPAETPAAETPTP